MIRRPPRSTLFPTRRSSDLGNEQQSDMRIAADIAEALEHAVAVIVGKSKLRRCGHSHEPGSAALERRSEEHTSELQSRRDLVCRLLLEKKKTIRKNYYINNT